MLEVICDSREQKPWTFVFNDDVNTTRAGLKLGDYTTKKLKDILVIERKATTSELAINLGQKKDRTRFFKELDSLKNYQHAYIICEFPESRIYEYPKNSGLPKKLQNLVKLTGRGLRKLLADVEQEFGVIVIFCDDKQEAEDVAYSIMSSLEKRYAGDLSTRKQS